jgi:hypothetical protein
MKRIHALVVAFAVAVAVVTGTFATVRTTALGAGGETATVSDAEIEKRETKLDRAERKLRKAKRQRPPALPPLPQSVAVSSAPAASVASFVDDDSSGPGSGQYDDDSSGHGSGHDDDFDDHDDSSGHGSGHADDDDEHDDD